MTRYTFCESLMKICHLKSETLEKIQQQLTSWYSKLWQLIKHTICESLVIKVQYFRHEWSFKKIKGCSITGSQICHLDIPKCVNLFYTQSMKVWCIYLLPNTNAGHFCDENITLFELFWVISGVLVIFSAINKVLTTDKYKTTNRIKQN